MSRCIDADALLRSSIFEFWQDGNAITPTGEYILSKFRQLIEDMPTIEPEPQKGKWTNGEDMPDYPRVPYHFGVKYCSECRNEAYWDTDYGQQLFDFCPNCGSSMEG